jgi:serine/threonine protein kinase
MELDKLQGVVLGPVTLEECLSSNSTNIVVTYKAYQPSLKRHVAVQILNPELKRLQFSTRAGRRWGDSTQILDLELERFQKAFLRGAETIASLEHPNILPVYECGIEGNLAYIVTRFMASGTLLDLIEQRPLSPSEAAAIIRQIGNALDYVHSRGMVHGDPSTTNIIFDPWGSAYIANFIMAGLLSDAEGISGTPAYMAPERWLELPVTPMSDQYALGAITYHMLTGQNLFPTENMGNLLQQHMNASPPRLSPDFPVAINDVLYRALAKLPDDRYPTVMDFAREFEKAIQAVPQHLFISYSRRDKDYAAQLSEHLGGNGFHVWIDSQIEYGDAWFNEIDEAIKSCAAFLLLMSPESYRSEWVQKEILLAKRYKKPIFPLLLQGEEFGIVIDLQFADVKDQSMPDANFHRRLRRTVFGDI